MSEWTERDGGLRWDRDDGAYVERHSGFAGKRPWMAFSASGRPLSGRLYADWDIDTGPARTFGSARTAMQAIDRALKVKP